MKRDMHTCGAGHAHLLEECAPLSLPSSSRHAVMYDTRCAGVAPPLRVLGGEGEDHRPPDADGLWCVLMAVWRDFLRCISILVAVRCLHATGVMAHDQPTRDQPTRHASRVPGSPPRRPAVTDIWTSEKKNFVSYLDTNPPRSIDQKAAVWVLGTRFIAGACVHACLVSR